MQSREKNRLDQQVRLWCSIFNSMFQRAKFQNLINRSHYSISLEERWVKSPSRYKWYYYFQSALRRLATKPCVQLVTIFDEERVVFHVLLITTSQSGTAGVQHGAKNTEYCQLWHTNQVVMNSEQESHTAFLPFTLKTWTERIINWEDHCRWKPSSTVGKNRQQWNYTYRHTYINIRIYTHKYTHRN